MVEQRRKIENEQVTVNISQRKQEKWFLCGLKSVQIITNQRENHNEKMSILCRRNTR